MSRGNPTTRRLGPFDDPKPPYKNPEAEKALLGCFLIMPQTLDELGRFFTPDDFSDGRLVCWLQGIQEVHQPGGMEVDQVLLSEALKRAGRYPHDSGEIFQHELVNFADTSRVWEYARIVLENAVARKRLEAANILAAGDTEKAKRLIVDIDARLAAFRALADGEPQPNEPAIKDQVDVFPLDVLPKSLQAFAREGAHAIHCPVDFFGAPMLAAMGVAIGNSRCLEIKASWRERAWLWLALVAQTGDKKSPALDRVMEPLERRQTFLQSSFDADHQRWESSRKENPDQQEPRRMQVYTTDSTIEVLADILSVNPRGVLYFRDELNGWVLSMNQYKSGKGSDRPNWLSFWNGGLVDISRRGRRLSLALHKPFVGVLGALPPDLLGDLSDERGREDGFIHRILFAFPDSIPRRYTEDVISESARESYQAVFDWLCDLKPEPDKDGKTTPKALRFTRAGKQKWVEWITGHYREQECPDFPTTLRGHWNKLEGYCARFALILHLCRLACEETTSEDVDEVSMAGAAKLVDYFKSHARRVYRHLYATPEDNQVLAAVAWIGRQPGQKTNHRQFQRSGLQGVRTADDAKRLLLKLADRGYGIAEEAAVRGGKRLVFVLHHHLTPDTNRREQENPAA